MARTTSAASTTALVTVTHPVVTLRDQREGKFAFPTSASHPQVTAEAAARIARERFDADDALIEFVMAKGWTDLKTQAILNNVRAEGFAVGMARLNRLMGRDAKGSALPAKAE
ncbi:hypothetical protein PQR39_21140 [Paraburkholderia sediminicola]|uniref:hypothetical protein n=1 Tax=Paraburkholderia sediminicola TaxID=458836 RepID=UPI0038BA0BD9